MMFSPFHYVFGALFEHKTGVICLIASPVQAMFSDWLPLALASNLVTHDA
jgi:hypothetical protein